MTIGTLKSLNPRNRKSISVIKSKFLSEHFDRHFESLSRETGRHTGRRTKKKKKATVELDKRLIIKFWTCGVGPEQFTFILPLKQATHYPKTNYSTTTNQPSTIFHGLHSYRP